MLFAIISEGVATTGRDPRYEITSGVLLDRWLEDEVALTVRLHTLAPHR